MTSSFAFETTVPRFAKIADAFNDLIGAIPPINGQGGSANAWAERVGAYDSVFAQLAEAANAISEACPAQNEADHLLAAKPTIEDIEGMTSDYKVALAAGNDPALIEERRTELEDALASRESRLRTHEDATTTTKGVINGVDTEFPSLADAQTPTTGDFPFRGAGGENGGVTEGIHDLESGDSTADSGDQGTATGDTSTASSAPATESTAPSTSTGSGVTSRISDTAAPSNTSLTSDGDASTSGRAATGLSAPTSAQAVPTSMNQGGAAVNGTGGMLSSAPNQARPGQPNQQRRDDRRDNDRRMDQDTIAALISGTNSPTNPAPSTTATPSTPSAQTATSGAGTNSPTNTAPANTAPSNPAPTPGGAKTPVMPMGLGSGTANTQQQAVKPKPQVTLTDADRELLERARAAVAPKTPDTPDKDRSDNPILVK